MKNSNLSAPITVTVNTKRGIEEVPVLEDHKAQPVTGHKVRQNKGAVLKGLATEPKVLEDGTKTAVVVARVSLKALDLSRFQK